MKVEELETLACSEVVMPCDLQHYEQRCFISLRYLFMSFRRNLITKDMFDTEKNNIISTFKKELINDEKKIKIYLKQEEIKRNLEKILIRINNEKDYKLKFNSAMDAIATITEEYNLCNKIKG